MRKILAIAAVSLGVSLISAIIAELAFGTWFSTDPLDRLGLARDTAISVMPAPPGPAFTYGRDHWGFRGSGTDPAAITIVTVGGSATNQPYLADDQTWQAVMERDFRAAGQAAVVVNAGMEGQSTRDHQRALEQWFPLVPGLKPGFILFQVGLHDSDPGAPLVDRLRHSPRLSWVREHSALWRVADSMAHWMAPPAIVQAPPAVDYAHTAWTDKPARSDTRSKTFHAALADYKVRLANLAQLTHAMGAVPVFITQARGDYRVVEGKVQGVATAAGANGIDHFVQLAEFNQATREVCRDSGLLCLDPARELDFGMGDFHDTVQNSQQGAEKLGHWLYGKLAGLV